MQKILRFEFNTATKDRPKAYQLVTLVLFSLAVAIVVVSTLLNATDGSHADTQPFNQQKSTHYTSFAASPSPALFHLKK